MSDETVTQDETAAHPHEGRAIRHVGAHLRFWLVGLAALWLDLWSKSWVFANLSPTESRTFIDDIVIFHRSLNDGAVFGFFTGQVSLFIIASVFAFVFVFYLFASSHRSQWFLHIALGLILSGALGNLYDRAVNKADIVQYTTRAGLPDKIIGKLLPPPDAEHIRIGSHPEGLFPKEFARSGVTITQQGVVRDFIKFVPKFPKWVPKLGGHDVWPWIFNVADAALVCGVIILLFTSLSHRRREVPT